MKIQSYSYRKEKSVFCTKTKKNSCNFDTVLIIQNINNQSQIKISTKNLRVNFTFFHTSRPLYNNNFLFKSCQLSTNFDSFDAFNKPSPFSSLFWSRHSLYYKILLIFYNFFLLLQIPKSQPQFWTMKLNFSIPNTIPHLAKVVCPETCRPVLYPPHFRRENLFPCFVEFSENICISEF